MKITLHSGRTIKLLKYYADLTYEGLIEGFSSKKSNDRILQSSQEKAKALFQTSLTIHLLPPKIKIRELPDIPELPKSYPVLPAYCCAAMFHSFEVARNKQKDYSLLAVVWFQDDLTQIIASDLLDELQGFDWNQLAEDFDY
jgi:hypothetical protein